MLKSIKIVFEHQGRKATIIGDDYETIGEKIRLLFPNENHRRIQFYDPELSDVFEFTSYEQVRDQSNGLKMNFDLSISSDLYESTPSRSPKVIENEKFETLGNASKPTTAKRSRKQIRLDDDDSENNVPVSLPNYCYLIVQGLKTRKSFPAIKQEFLRQTCTYYIQSYPECSSRKRHHSFIMALTIKYPALKFLNTQ
ncbi:unnamed protein product, partial [Rotaria socialis]